MVVIAKGIPASYYLDKWKEYTGKMDKAMERHDIKTANRYANQATTYHRKYALAKQCGR